MTPPVAAGVPPSTLPGLGNDDLGAAWAAFHAGAVADRDGRPVLRPACPVTRALRRCFAAALALGPAVPPAEVAAFLDHHFVACHPGTDEAFFTGYYEPEVDGAPAAGPGFTAPLLARPDDLQTFAAGEARPPWAATLAAARRGADGALAPYPERMAIEAEAMTGAYHPVVWLRDWVEAFLIHVQGSARVRLPDGTGLRLTYAGRNGHPYTSIGRILVQRGDVPATEMSLTRLKAWLRAAGQQPGEPGRAVMAQNRSFIFFDAVPDDGQPGPTGGAGLPLTPLRSIAVDRSAWCYGLPFWIDAALPWEGSTPTPFRHLCVAQDTGSAIVGPARVDLFMGSGPAAGARAGDIRHPGQLRVLWPRDAEPRP